MQHVVDSSSILDGWVNYPHDRFPPFWDWVKKELSQKSLIFPQATLDEVKNKFPECGDFLQNNNATILPVDNDVFIVANKIKEQLGIKDDQYSRKNGVCENDLLIISQAVLLRKNSKNVTLLTNEAHQGQLPPDPKHYKIPAVCANITNPRIKTMTWLGYLNTSSQIYK